MFAIPGLLLLIILIYARPQEFWSSLQSVPLLYVAFGLTVCGVVVDWRLRNTRLFATPQLRWVAFFYIWCIVSALLHTPRTVHLQALDLGISIILYLLIAHGVQTFRGLNAVAAAVVVMVVFVAVVGVHQGMAPQGCVLIDETVIGDQTTGTPDGRPCQAHLECYAGDAEPGGHYMCERVGLFGTTSISDGRVRYRGVLQDPNELALAASIGIPLALVLAWRRPRFFRWSTALSILGLVLLCTILTRSRGGQLVFLTVLAAYFIKRFGMRGVVIGGLIGLPVLVLGGRSGLEATASTMERIESWYEAISMFRSNPPMGIGFRQFHEYHYLTAHNSYLLTLAELGLPGLILFTSIIFISAKIPLTVLQRYTVGSPGLLGRLAGTMLQAGPAVQLATLQQAEVARKWALALLAAFAGLGVGIFFLSFAYHYILWIYVGLSGALYSAVKLHDPAFEVGFGWRDLLLVAAFDATLILGMFAYTRLMLG